MFRKPSLASVEEAKKSGHERPPATPMGTFQVPNATTDKLRAAAAVEAGKRLGVPSQSLVVSFQVGEISRGVEQRSLVVYAPAPDQKATP